jgi:hypothetical protein
MTQRTGGPTDIADLEISGENTPMEHKTACKVATTGLQDPNVLKSDPMWPEVPDEQTRIWKNDQKSTFEFFASDSRSSCGGHWCCS